MKRKLIFLLSLILTISIVIVCSLVPFHATQKTSNRFNVVLVIDASGSMKQTDPDNLRYDATKLFLGLLANDGNYVGSIVFSTDVDKVTKISELKGIDDKNSIEKDIESIEPDIGDTAIGVALDKAVNMIIDDGNEDLPSVIVLLSDGKTDLSGDQEAEKNSNDLKAEAIYNAHEKGIRIFTVGLNSNGGADMAELEQISNGTSGECQEVKDASDLKDVFAQFYNLIYSTSTTTIFDDDIGADGIINASFNVPNAGVEEVNIIISSESSIKNLTLIPPQSSKMSVDDVKKLTTTSKSFTITKLTSPKGGKWLLYAEGKPGDRVKIDMVYNDCLSVATEYNKDKDYHVGDTLIVNGFLYNYDEKASHGYDDYEATIYLTKSISDNKEDDISKEIEMETLSSNYSASIPIDEIGTYTIYMQVVGNGMEKSTKDSPITITVGNSAPVVTLESGKIEEHINAWPFFTKEHDIDLSEAVVDTEDNSLKYSIENTAFKDTTYELNGTTLKIIDFFDLSKGSFTVKATDSMGASTEFEVVVTITNLGIIALIILGGSILIVLIIIGVITYIALNKRFLGNCYLSTFNHETGEYSEEVMRKKNRGRISLAAFGLTVPGFPTAKCYIQASGKDFVTLVAKKPICVEGKMTKKHQIDGGGMNVEIKESSNAQKGFSIRFESRLNKSIF